MWNGRVIIPSSLLDCSLEALHEGHPGRKRVWWPTIDKSIERFVKHCNKCQENRPPDQENPLIVGTYQRSPGFVYTWTWQDFSKENHGCSL